ncbi:MAG: RNA polymerase factor sigma-54 [Phycisphaerales bacterium]|nr:RNA polymerase factor sigma-54 [Phycisphaerales bacterium]
MSQVLSQIPRQLLQQQQRLTPQLIQAMDILQLNALALESRLEHEVDSNPALELLSDEAEYDRTESAESAPEALADRDGSLEVGDAAEDFERLDSLVTEYDWLDDDYVGRRSGDALAEAGDQKLEAMSNTAARPAGLHDYLLSQWGLAEHDERTHALGNALIEHIDDHGRLGLPLDELASTLVLEPPVTPAELEQALRLVQKLDPPGIAARSVQECLLLQLAALPGRNDLEERILREHFEDLQKNRVPQIARALGVEVEEIKAAIGVIAQLHLHPGSEMVERLVPSIVPDLIVEYDEEYERYEVRLARSNQRELRISPEFRELLQRAGRDKATREFIKQKIEAANAIIDAVRFRRERLLDVARAVVAAQREFLDQGEQHLRVLRMSDLAERFECDPSTISRTVDEKYMQTPRGVYPLRMFFTGGATTDEGDALGWASIRAKVEEIIRQEDKRNPLNDDEIVERLAAEGVEIKRRTVAKYRSQLDIPPARQRRQF